MTDNTENVIKTPDRQKPLRMALIAISVLASVVSYLYIQSRIDKKNYDKRLDACETAKLKCEKEMNATVRNVIDSMGAINRQLSVDFNNYLYSRINKLEERTTLSDSTISNNNKIIKSLKNSLQ